jgi:hypothetical protein
VDDDEVAQRAPYPRARRVDQLKSNLAALESVLPAEAITRLEAATEFDVGFPSDFIAETTPWVLGEADRVEQVTKTR